jgi:CBS domain-containing protein
MSTPVVALDATASVSDAARVLASRKFGAVPIADGRGRPTAIVTEIDLLAHYGGLTSHADRADEFIVGRMQTELVTVSPDEPTSNAVSLFFQHQLRHLPVVADDVLVGMISDRDVRRTVGESCSPEHALRQPIAEIMSRTPVTAKPDFTMHEAAAMLQRLKLGALPVLEGPELLGIITVTDVLTHLAELCGGARLGGVPALRCGLHDGEATIDPIVIA